MIKGIGVDAVSIRKTEMLLNFPGSTYAEYTYTREELRRAGEMSDSTGYLADRFAAKEAVYKTLAPLTKNGAFNMRCIEILNREDGSPYVSVNDELRQVMEEAGVSSVLVSITTEKDMAIAFAVAEA